MLPIMKSAASKYSRGTKRLAVEAFNDEVAPPKKGFFESLNLLSPFKGVLSLSSPKDTGNSAGKNAPSLVPEVSRLPSDHGSEQQQTAEDMAAAIDAQQEELIVQEIKLMGGIPKEAAEQAAFNTKLIDRVVEKRREEEEVAKFKLSCPEFNMDIRQQDEDWIKKRKFFVDELKVPHKTIMNILDETFTNTQQLYLIPPWDEGGTILKIQREHTKKYKEALGPTGTFRGVPDNLATKLTMLFFGLPIEPLTENNITMSGEEGDITCEPDKEPDPPMVQRIMYAEKPLEFLDSYSEGRSHGYPMLRRPKRRDLIPPSAIPSPMASAPFANASTPNSTPAEKVVGLAPANVSQAKTAGSAAAPAQTPTKAHHGLPNFGHGTPQIHHYQPFINPGQSPATMRGGGLAAGVETEDEFEPAAAQPTDRSPALSENFIYGYNGKFLCQNEPDSFKKTALQLLGYDFEATGPWSFLVDLYKPNKTEPTILSIQRNQTRYLTVFRESILPYLQGNPWRVFVRSGRDMRAHSAGMLEPCRKGMKDVVRLVGPDDETAYWKIPKDVKPNYGINQCQPGFLNAMKLLFNDDQFPPQGPINLRFRDPKKNSTVFDLGWGGTEATVEIWEAVCEAFLKLDPGAADSIDILVGTSQLEALGDREMGAYMVGSVGSAQASLTNHEHTYDRIAEVLSIWVVEPVAFRVWHDAHERDTGSTGEVIQLKPKKNAVEALKNFFEGWQSRTNCCWFRPEWSNFTLKSLDTDPPAKDVKWPGAPASQGLGTLKSILQPFVGGGEALQSFTLVEAQSEQDGRQFVVTEDTTDREWRLHIYDWLRTNKVFFKKNTNIRYVLDQSPWAISPSISTVFAPLPEAPSQSTTMVTQNTPEAEEDMESIRGPLMSHRLTRRNRERIVKSPAGKPKAQKWSDWMTEQDFLNGLQRRSWIKDQSVVEPGRMPAPPLYGASRELQLRVGSSMPTIYIQRLTPTDIKQLQNENQKLRNQVLDRIFTCPICDEDFETFEKDKIRDHCRQHQEQLAEAGQCPSCGDPQWAFLTNDQKRSHFAIHRHQHESAIIKKFYEDQCCPVCDRDLSKMKADLVIRHCLEHAPGQVQFCDRCGLNELDCTNQELNHHHLKCRLADDRNTGDPEPVFCENCGMNITRATDEENQAHQKDCYLGPKGRFCMKCGLNETGHGWEKAAIAKHNSHCTPPSGFNKKYCTKCRTELGSLGEAEIAQHRNTCRLVEPGLSTERSRIIELKARHDAARVTEARLNTFKAVLDNKEENQNYREEILVRRESELEEKLSTYDALSSDINKLKQAQSGGHQVGDYDEDDHDVCPISLCSIPISNMSKAETVAHIRTHLDKDLAPAFVLPLENAHGDRCNHDISLKDDGFDLTVHYNHKLSEDEQETAKDNVSKTLRASIQAARLQADSNVAFIKTRSHLLITPKTPPPPFSAGKAKTTAPEKNAFTSALTHHVSADAWEVMAAMGSTQPPQVSSDGSTSIRDTQAKEQTFVGTDGVERAEAEALAELAPPLPQGGDEAVGTRAARKARDALAAARKRRASVSEQVYKPPREDDSTAEESDVAEPPPNKKGRPAKVAPVKAAPVKAAPVKLATVTNKKRKQSPVETESVSTRKKRVTASKSKIAKKVLAGMDSDEEDGHATEKKARAVKSSPVKMAPSGSKKRKQVAVEEELTVTKKSLRNAPSSAPAKKKPKKAEEEEETEEAEEAATVGELNSKSTRARRRRKKTRLSGGRGPAKI